MSTAKKDIESTPDAGAVDIESTAWFGDMGDGSKAPANTDAARLDWLERHPGIVKNMTSGVQTRGIDVWQPGFRPAIDAAMELMRRELRAKGMEPVW